MIVPCDCGAKLKIDESKIAGKAIKVRCPRCGNLLPVQGLPVAERAASTTERSSTTTAAPLILIAHDSDVVRAMISNVLSEAEFLVDTAADGHEALRKAFERKPKAIVLDVGLPGIYGFDLCARIKDNPETSFMKVILVSSVYDMKRYKRTPASLYGADDYVEKHHIQDLPSKLKSHLQPAQKEASPQSATEAKLSLYSGLPEMSRPPAREFEPSLLGSEALSQMADSFPDLVLPPLAPSPIPTEKSVTPESFSLEASIFQKEECNIVPVEETDPEAVEKAKRFARIIVSDVALYNQEAVVRGIKTGTFYDLLKNDIEEGRELYEKRVPAAIRAKKDHYQEAFDNFITAAKKKLLDSA